MSIDRRVLPHILRQRAVVFDRLEVVNDAEFRSGAMNMAIDEALLEYIAKRKAESPDSNV